MRAWLASLWLFSSASFAGGPQFNYVMECQGCHAADGSGSVSSVPSLKDQMARFLGVPGGREFLVQVPGAAQSSLNDAALADVLNWMLREFGPADVARHYPQYDADEVGRLRRKPLTEISVARAALIQRIEEGQH